MGAPPCSACAPVRAGQSQRLAPSAMHLPSTPIRASSASTCRALGPDRARPCQSCSSTRSTPSLALLAPFDWSETSDLNVPVPIAQGGVSTSPRPAYIIPGSSRTIAKRLHSSLHSPWPSLSYADQHADQRARRPPPFAGPAKHHRRLHALAS